MEWSLVEPWVNRVGIVLEFLSFWLAAPEILGEERLKKLERRVERGIRVLSARMMWVIFLATVMIYMAVMRFGGPTIRCMESAVASVTSRVLARIVVAAVWGVLGFVAGMAGVQATNKLRATVVQPLLRVLADNERIRQRSLAAGAVLFVVGFLLQLVATF
jgi:hypothetical protein